MSVAKPSIWLPVIGTALPIFIGLSLVVIGGSSPSVNFAIASLAIGWASAAWLAYTCHRLAYAQDRLVEAQRELINSLSEQNHVDAGL